MKRTSLISLSIAAAMLVFTLASCDTKPAASTPAATTQATTTTTAVQQTTKAPTTTAPTTATPTSPTEKDAVTTAPTTAGTTAVQTDTPAKGSVEELAKSLIGSPYKLGASGPKEFDNSGFLVYCYGQKGIALPRFTSEIAKKGTPVEMDALKPGDAVFFYNDTPGAAQFAGIYVGNNEFVSCDNEEKPVVVHNISYPYFKDRFVGARRFTA